MVSTLAVSTPEKLPRGASPNKRLALVTVGARPLRRPSDTPLDRAVAEAKAWNVVWPTLDMAEIENNIGTPLSVR